MGLRSPRTTGRSGRWATRASKSAGTADPQLERRVGLAIELLDQRRHVLLGLADIGSRQPDPAAPA